MEENTNINSEFEYGSDAIKTLDWKEHIRRRPGMYIGKLGTVLMPMTAFMYC